MKTIKRVMAVDDTSAVCRLIERLFRNEPAIIIETFESPQEALKRYKEISFDLVITDYQMPEMTGEDLAHELWAINPNIKIIIHSGSDNVNCVKNYRDFGFADRISKPTENNLLINTIKKNLE